MMPDRSQMANYHEDYLAQLNEGVRSRGSGSQPHDKGDGRNQHLDPADGGFSFCWDGKSTLGKGITVTREMIDKITEEAAGERPMLGLRWYDTDNLQRVGADWIAVSGADWCEVLLAARRAAGLEATLAQAEGDPGARIAELAQENAKLRARTASVVEALQARDQQVLELSEQLRSAQHLLAQRSQQPGPGQPAAHLAGMLRIYGTRDVNQALTYRGLRDVAGRLEPAEEEIRTVVIEHDPHDAAIPVLVVNDQRVRLGEVYIDGRLECKVP
jgi:hypothetical protein